jgi:hypothetical protein
VTRRLPALALRVAAAVGGAVSGWATVAWCALQLPVVAVIAWRATRGAELTKYRH